MTTYKITGGGEIKLTSDIDGNIDINCKEFELDGQGFSDRILLVECCWIHTHPESSGVIKNLSVVQRTDNDFVYCNADGICAICKTRNKFGVRDTNIIVSCCGNNQVKNCELITTKHLDSFGSSFYMKNNTFYGTPVTSHHDMQ